MEAPNPFKNAHAASHRRSSREIFFKPVDAAPASASASAAALASLSASASASAPASALAFALASASASTSGMTPVLLTGINKIKRKEKKENKEARLLDHMHVGRGSSSTKILRTPTCTQSGIARGSGSHTGKIFGALSHTGTHKDSGNHSYREIRCLKVLKLKFNSWKRRRCFNWMAAKTRIV